jgi:protocatechuate 3,4-dioxygenase alpha subunit
MEHVPTPSQTVGPFLHLGLTDKCSRTRIAAESVSGERVHLKCRVLDADSVPVSDAMIEIWQADAEGKYNHPDDPNGTGADAAFHGFGRAATDENGACEFETIKPGPVTGNSDAMQAPHLNVAVYARGILLHLYTRIYFAGENSNDQDPVLALVPKERRATLMAQPDVDHSGMWTFDIRVRGEHETVFFDI